VYRETIESRNALEREAELLPHTAKQSHFSSHPERTIFPGQDFVDQIAGQPAFSGVALPLAVSSPLYQPPAGHSDPERVLAVLVGGVDGSTQAVGAADGLPTLRVLDKQPLWRVKKDPSTSIDAERRTHAQG
jgi:hypothetical protein